jgi:hypothetical protein
MLTKEEVTSYNKNGYLLVENAVSESQLIQLRRLMTEFIDKSRHVRESNEVYDLDKRARARHSAPHEDQNST